MTSIIDLAQVNQGFNNKLVEMISADQIGVIALAAAMTIGLTALASAFAKKRIGKAVIEAMTRHKIPFGKLLVMVVIFGVVIALLMVVLL